MSILSVLRAWPTRLTAVVLALVGGLYLLTMPGQTQAASITAVDTTAVANNPNDGRCDLWEALQAIADYNYRADTDSNGSFYTYHECSANSGPHQIVFTGQAAGGTIRLNPALSPALPWVTHNVTIKGPIVIDGNGGTLPNQVDASVFHTNVGGILTLENLVVQNAFTSGAGSVILSLGSQDQINIIASSFHNNRTEGHGGVISTAGSLTVLASNFSGNRALGVDGDWGDSEGLGGAIYQSGYGTLNISMSNFAGNIATEGGGAIYTGADAGQISDTVFNGNIVDDDAPTSTTKGGGAIFNHGNNDDYGLTITRSAFNGNLSFDGPGGAIQNGSDGYLHIYDSSFNANIAGNLSNEHMGGAIYNMQQLNVYRSAFIANVSAQSHGGGIANDRRGEIYLANVTLSGNGAPYGEGGALWNGNTQTAGPSSYSYLYNVTIADNVSQNDSSAIFNEVAGDHEVILANTIIDGIGGDLCNAPLTSQGNNIASDDSCGLDADSDLPNTDPDLGGLAFNGGPLSSLLSYSLNAGSPAIDAGNNDVCADERVTNQDQRSDPRPKGSYCDIGAFEAEPAVAGYGSNPVQPGPIVVGNTSIGTAVTNTFSILSVGTASLQVSDPTLGGDNPAEFSVVAPSFPLTIAAGSSRAVTVGCAGNSVGSHSATLTLSTSDPGKASVTYTLLCLVNELPVPGYGSTPAPSGTLDFAQLYLGQSKTAYVRFFETGNDTLQVSNAQLSGAHAADFSLGSFNGTIVDGGSAVNVPVICTPSDVGLRTAVLSLDTNDPQQATVSYNLVCQAIPLPAPPFALPGYSAIDGQDGVDGMDGAYDVAISPDGRFAYVTAAFDDSLTVFSIDPISNELSYVMHVTHANMINPAMVAVSPDGKQVYVTAIGTDAFLIFNRNSATGAVSLSNSWFNGSSGVSDMDYPFGIAVSPDGRYIYVTSFFDHAVVTFFRNSDDLVLYQESYVDTVNLDHAYLPVISPDGKHLYVSGGATAGTQNDGYVTTFERNLINGNLSFVQSWHEGDVAQCYGIICLYITGMGGAWGIDVSPDGQNVYVTGYYDNALVRYQRNPVDGRLTYSGYMANSLLRTAADEETGYYNELNVQAVQAEGLAGPMSVKVSHDGQYVYVASYLSDALAIFARPGTGPLVQIETIYDDNNNPALDSPRAISLNPTNTAVYITSYMDDALVALGAGNPQPYLNNISPASATAGTPGMTVQITGHDFVPGVVAEVNGQARPTEYITESEIKVELSSGDLATAGTLTLTAVNPAPAGGDSLNSLAFTVTAVNENPVPSLLSLSPTGAAAGDPALTVSLYGSHFMAGSVAYWNGQSRPTHFVSEQELQMSVTAVDLQIPGTAVVSVFNPGPGGGNSNLLPFTVAAPGQNPTPTIDQLAPGFTQARGINSTPLLVTVTGQNFVSGVQGLWNGQNRPTQYVSPTQIVVTLTGMDVAFGGFGQITAVNPETNGRASNAATFIIYPFAAFMPMLIK